MAPQLYAWDIFGTLFKNEMKAGLNDNNIKMDKLLEMNINLNSKIDANMKVVAGIDKSVQAGRDVNTTITNDPAILKSVIGVWSAIIMFLLKSQRDTKKWLMKMIVSKNKYKAKTKDLEEEKLKKAEGTTT
ncbi:hypothetical protein LCGC14_2585090 [marine sediment metagenome]|uniref:Uncharacterized protein n=1 Tax=marine sediment metagenome TaxID=412755 RepID=A0A0F9CPD6_9ZZZZ